MNEQHKNDQCMNFTECRDKVIQHEEQLKRLPETVERLDETVRRLELLMVRLEPLPEQVKANTADIVAVTETVNKVKGASILMSVVGGVILVGAGAVEVVSWFGTFFKGK